MLGKAHARNPSIREIGLSVCDHIRDFLMTTIVGPFRSKDTTGFCVGAEVCGVLVDENWRNMYVSDDEGRGKSGGFESLKIREYERQVLHWATMRESNLMSDWLIMVLVF